ncbi:MAG: WD40 repeat domain-containing protein, partial [Pirellulaceae bacterium]|nr:WD40 repeat domain-containing protein [Pirellulaceae bacterium]
EFNAPNVLDARKSAEGVLVLARSSDRDADNTQAFSGVRLFQLTNKADPRNSGFSVVDTLSQGETSDARFAIFSKLNPAEFVYLTNSENDSVRFRNWQNATTREISGIAGIRGVLARAMEDKSGNLTLQSTQPKPNDPSQRNWNTLSLNADRSAGPLRVEAQPAIDFVNVNGSRVVTLAAQVVQFWEIKDGLVSSRGRLPGFWDQCSISPNGNLMLVQPAGSNELQVFNSQDMNLVSRLSLPASNQPIESIAWSQDGNHLAIATDSEIAVWRVPNVQTESWPQPSQSLDTSGTQQLAFSDKGWALLAVNPNGTTRVYRVNGDAAIQSADWSKPNRSLDLVPVDGQTILAADISPDGDRVIAGGETGRLTLWNTTITDQESSTNAATGERELMSLTNRQKGHRSAITMVEFVPAGDVKNRHYEVVTLEANPEKSEYLIWETGKISAGTEETN